MVQLKKMILYLWTYFNSVNEYSVDGVNIKINKTNDVNQLLKLESNSIIAVLDGGFESDDNQLVLSPGDIVGLETIKKLAEVFKIQKYITYLTIWKIIKITYGMYLKKHR